MHYGKQIRIGNVSTSEVEIKDLIKAWIAISIAFAIAFSGAVLSSGFYARFVMAALTVGTGFLLHELGHKVVAQRYGCFAEFRSFNQMLLLAILMSFFGFIFAAPGAVMISGRVNKAKSGKISAAGPIVNLVLASLFLALIFLPLPSYSRLIVYYGFFINSWLAFFNMIPFWLFDGKKVLNWNKMVYASIVAVAVSFMLLRYSIPLPK